MIQGMKLSIKSSLMGRTIVSSLYLQTFCTACRPVTYSAQGLWARHYIFIAHSQLVSAKHRKSRDSGGTTATETPESFICLLFILLPLASCSLWSTIPVCWVVPHGDPLAVVFVPFQNAWQNCHRRSLASGSCDRHDMTWFIKHN